MPYTHQVNFDKVFVEGAFKGTTYRDCIRFCSDAVFFAKRDGLIVTPFNGCDAYKQANSKIVRI
jgi:hypothetical protein